MWKTPVSGWTQLHNFQNLIPQLWWSLLGKYCMGLVLFLVSTKLSSTLISWWGV
jgi:hypothetical protein